MAQSKELTNAKARLRAALKKLKKIENSGDVQAIAEAQSKVDFEQKSIDELESITVIEGEDEIAEPPNALPTNKTSDNEEINILVQKSPKKRKNDLPQVSFRIDDERYQLLKQHVKHPVSSHLSSFESLADMTRSLNLADLEGDIHFIIKRTHQQLARFLEAAQAENSSNLPASERSMLKMQFFAYNANTDEEKAELIEKIKSIYEHIEAVNLYEFIDGDR